MRKGYTLTELIVVIAIVVVLALTSLAYLVNRRNREQLTSTTASIAGLLRDAQSRSVTQSSSTTWGVHFENSTTTTPFFSLFATTYDSSSRENYHSLPVWVGYVTSSIDEGSSAEIIFDQISGAANGSSSISIYLLQAPSVSSTISVSGAGAISY